MNTMQAFASITRVWGTERIIRGVEANSIPGTAEIASDFLDVVANHEDSFTGRVEQEIAIVRNDFLSSTMYYERYEQKQTFITARSARPYLDEALNALIEAGNEATLDALVREAVHRFVSDVVDRVCTWLPEAFEDWRSEGDEEDEEDEDTIERVP